MIARVLSGGPLFVPRGARNGLAAFKGGMTDAKYTKAIWYVRECRNPTIRWSSVPYPFPPTTRTGQGFVLHRNAEVIPFPKGAA